MDHQSFASNKRIDSIAEILIFIIAGYAKDHNFAQIHSLSREFEDVRLTIRKSFAHVGPVSFYRGRPYRNRWIDDYTNGIMSLYGAACGSVKTDLRSLCLDYY
ncbi:hypothetical protein LEP1GSC047_2858 [Leptospira inadai serovar Lyme str. 10]|uniref:Uncharacterized protein n=2 Tax=Leptospira inadai serovar Lyme TaxID=293084 RepID=V6HUY4_9LEPT|nr:hypothetical protein [Leptospira inadai]EQA36614.1 hypothetical protein LEP1GSC047_2858 [Leptospira inadai serovar Lyme str. 10]PNV73634.1 hypothetical protein BES34_016390 [Leptospira inadai serovar Lyme]